MKPKDLMSFEITPDMKDKKIGELFEPILNVQIEKIKEKFKLKKEELNKQEEIEINTLKESFNITHIFLPSNKTKNKSPRKLSSQTTSGSKRGRPKNSSSVQ